jgi:energy-coupling factor transport system permease protein
MSRMPTGHYLPGYSAIHRLDARVKMLSYLILLAAVISTSALWGYLLLIGFTGGIILLSGLPLSSALASLRRLWTFFLVIFLMNALFFNAGHSLWSWWIFHLSRTGILQGANVVLRLALLIVLGNVLTCTTAPLSLTAALESLMAPLKLLRIPVEEAAMIIGVAVQFIPTLSEETEMIKKAQTARGARFESRRLTERAASYFPLVIPIFLSAFRRADELSQAMEARGYRNARNRTKRARAPLHSRDAAALLVSAALCLVQIRFLG